MESSPQDKILQFPHLATSPWIEAYTHAELVGKNEATQDAYLRILHQIAAWVAHFPGSAIVIFYAPYRNKRMPACIVAAACRKLT